MTSITVNICVWVGNTGVLLMTSITVNVRVWVGNTGVLLCYS
jgi:hypothetical protein